jgi:hypothetical protein
MAKGKEVTVAAGTDVAERPEYMGEPSGRGSEEVTIQDITIPRLSIIQDLSPQHKKNKSEYIDGAGVGMLFDTVTNALYETSVLFVPVYFRLEWVVWKNRDAGGGFVGAYQTQDQAVEAVGQHPNAGQTTEKGDPVLEVQDTAQHFGLLMDPNSPAEDPRATEIVISMSRSQLKPSRQFNSMIRIATGDRWERYYRLSAIEAQNQAGQDYFNWKVEQLGFVSQAVFAQAESLYNSVKSGERDVERGQPQQQEDDSEDNM